MIIKISILGTEKVVFANSGDNLLSCLRNADIAIRADCSGIGKCGKCRVIIDGEPALACKTILTHDVTVSVPDAYNGEELSAEANDLLTASQAAAGAGTNRSYGDASFFVAIDLGTTTIAVSLIDKENGSVISSSSFLNPQFPFGADVISRINASLDDSSKLSELVRGRLADEMYYMLTNSGIEVSDVSLIVIAGNTTMSYILLGLPCRSLGFAPFAPEYQAGGYYDGEILFGTRFSDVKSLLIPYLSAFVGGDITSGLISADYESDYFIIDMGTNGELAYMAGGKLFCSSTAAGPAFEGVNLTCGMGGTAGAVSSIRLDDEELDFSTIADETPVGICGSGVLDMMACLIKSGAVRSSGKLESEHHLVSDKQIVISGDVVFTQKDIREFQLAKSAIRSGIEILISEAGGAIPDSVLLAGGFGQHLNPESAFITGLLPESLRGKVSAAGNTSLAGAVKIGFNPELLSKADDYIKMSREINLATHPEFSNLFMDFMRL